MHEWANPVHTHTHTHTHTLTQSLTRLLSHTHTHTLLHAKYIRSQMDDMTVKINRGEDSVRLWFLTVMIEDAATGRVLQAG